MADKKRKALVADLKKHGFDARLDGEGVATDAPSSEIEKALARTGQPMPVIDGSKKQRFAPTKHTPTHPFFTFALLGGFGYGVYQLLKWSGGRIQESLEGVDITTHEEAPSGVATTIIPAAPVRPGGPARGRGNYGK